MYNINTKLITKLISNINTMECCICYTETPTVLECKHTICNECLKRMKKSRRTLCCPMCRWKPRVKSQFKLYKSLNHLDKFVD